MRSIAIVAIVAASVAALGSPVRAEDLSRFLSASSVIVMKARPIAVIGLLRRAGAGWSPMLREQARLPQLIDPLDPTVIGATGIALDEEHWMGLVEEKGWGSYRFVVALQKPESAPIAVALVGTIFGASLTRGADGTWSGASAKHTIVARVVGSVLVVDDASGDKGKPLPSVKTVVRACPVRPVRPFVARGTAKRFEASDAIALWFDLVGGGKPSIGQPARCAGVARAPGTFEDLFVTFRLSSPERAHADIVLGGTAKRIATLSSEKPTHPARSFVPDAEAQGTLVLGDPAPLRGVLAPMEPSELARVKASGELTLGACAGDDDGTGFKLRRGPELVRKYLAETKPQDPIAGVVRVLAGLRSAAFWLTGQPDDPWSGGTAFAELDDAVRGDLDRLIANVLTPTTPLRIGYKQMTTYAVPGISLFGTDPVLFVEPLPEGGTIVGLGARDRLRQTHERAVRSADGNLGKYVLRATVPAKLVTAATQQSPPHLFDGIQQIDAELVREPEAVRLSADIALAPSP